MDHAAGRLVVLDLDGVADAAQAERAQRLALRGLTVREVLGLDGGDAAAAAEETEPAAEETPA
jgi:hypothetical protein